MVKGNPAGTELYKERGREPGVRKDRARDDMGICKTSLGRKSRNVDQQNSRMFGFIEDNAMRRPLAV